MNNLNNKISTFYDKNGSFETFEYIMSGEQVFLHPRNVNCALLNRSKELTLLSKGERSLIWFVNNFDSAKKRSHVHANNNIYNYTIERKISHSQIKVLKSKVKKMSKEQKEFFEFFKDVPELYRGNLQKKSVAKKLSKIHAFYTARVPVDLDYDKILEELLDKGFKISRQGLIAFLSLVLEKGDGGYFSIPSNLWESFFGRRNIKDAKLAFEEQGLLILHKNALPGFRSAKYKFGFQFDLNTEFSEINITSIRALEKINRIKYYESNFRLSEKIEALKILRELEISRLNANDIGRNKNFTNIFLRSRMFADLIKDLETVHGIVSHSEPFMDEQNLAKHLMSYIYKFDANNFTRYSKFSAYNN